MCLVSIPKGAINLLELNWSNISPGRLDQYFIASMLKQIHPRIQYIYSRIYGFNLSIIVLLWKHGWEYVEVQQMETEILVLHLLDTASYLTEDILAKSLFEISRKSKCNKKTCPSSALVNTFCSQDFLRSPAVSAWIHLPPLAGWLPAMCTSPANAVPFAEAPIHFVTSSFPSLQSHLSCCGRLYSWREEWIQPGWVHFKELLQGFLD